MIPLRLEVRNFLCYREEVPALDFSGIHLACLCGQNGHGKSALLDAVTWCLWGKARARSQDELVSYGADACRVQLDFSSRDESYRVIRSHFVGRGRRRQGATDLQLQVISSVEPVAITGNTIRESQAKIEQIVGMDYDTFINSAFLLQGRADEFTNKPPAERKAVLAKILSLETYDLLQDRARERLAKSARDAQELEGRLAEMNRQVESVGDPSPELEGLDGRLAQMNQDLERGRDEGDALRREVAQLETRQRQLVASKSQMEGLGRDLEKLALEENASQVRLGQFQAIVGQAGHIREGMASLKEARDRLDRMEQARAAYDELDRQRSSLAAELQDARTRLEVQFQELQKRVEVELPLSAHAEPELLTRLEQLDFQQGQLARQRQSAAQLRERAQAVATEVGEAKSAATRYEQEGKELISKLALLENGGPEGTVCPLCQTPLDQDSCGRLAESYQSQVEEKRALFRQNRARLNHLEKDLATFEKDVTTQEKALASEQRQLDAGRQEVDMLIRESRQAQAELETSSARLALLGKALEERTYAQEQQESLSRLEAEIRSLNYDEDLRRKFYQRTRELQMFDEQAGQLDRALESLPLEQESLSRIRETSKQRQEELQRLSLLNLAEEEALARLPELEAKLRELDQAAAALEAQRADALARRGFLVGQRNRRQQLLEDIALDAAHQVELREDQSVCQELVNAFGRQGVQAMLIETVVPRLEEETNLLLGRMTDNRMHVKLETQRERRTGRGEPIETLEINVNDELGPRSYEMFSGGEAFRVNLALRIALSKVLAQRVGAPLPTLFIDEGFGTQDAAGRERILDVLGAIQGDFEKIIVITHLDDIKESFPVRIEVQKDLDGSTFWLN